VRDSPEFWLRSLVTLLIIGTGIYAQRSVDKQKQMEAVLRAEISEHKKTEHALKGSERGMRRLYQIVSATTRPFDERAHKILELGCAHFGMPIGILARVNGDDYEVLHAVSPDNGIAEGSVFPLGKSYCRHAMESDGPVVVEHVADRQWRGHPALQERSLGAYVGARVMVEGIAFGTLSFSSPTPRDSELGWVDLDFLQLMAAWLGEELERRRVEESLRQAAIVFQNTTEGIMVTDAEGRLIRVNRAFTDITGYQSGDVLGKNPRLLCEEQHSAAFYRELEHSLETAGSWRGEATHRNKNGQLYPVWESIGVVRDEAQRVLNYVYVFSDITAVKQSEERLAHLAHHDHLTELPNRSMFFSHLEHTLARAERKRQKIAIMFLDLDGFKQINDELGHLVGDRVLQTIAMRLKGSMRHADLVARLGGDEFTMILDDIADPNDAGALAQKIIAVVQEPVVFDGREMGLSASLGISVYPDDARDAVELLKAADTAMYRCKEQGRNRFQFFSHP